MGMIAEFQAGVSVFHEGRELANAAVWKNRQVAGNHITLLLSAVAVIANGFGYNLHLDDSTIQVAGMGLAAMVSIANSALTVMTSAKVGIKPK